MRIIFAYRAGYAHPFALDAIKRYAPQAELKDVGENPHSYHRLLYETWDQGEGFLLIEHDVEIGPDTIPSFEQCQGDWCIARAGAPGNRPDNPLYMERSLCCTRFSSKLIAEHPDLILSLPSQDWRRLDCEIHPRLSGACMEHPVVRHHHFYSGHGCACGGDCPPHRSDA